MSVVALREFVQVFACEECGWKNRRATYIPQALIDLSPGPGQAAKFIEQNLATVRAQVVRDHTGNCTKQPGRVIT